MPDIIVYIVTGYVFLKTFHFVALKQNTTDVEHILISTLVVGYIYCHIAYIIPFSISYQIDIALIIMSALIMGYTSAKLSKSKCMIHILDRLKIRDTGNIYLWDDIMDDDYPMKAIISYDDIVYEGIIHNYESYSNAPHVALGSYVVKDNNGVIKNDYSEDNTRITILDTSKANNVEILYCKDSNECDDLQNLCKFHNIYKDN